MKEKRYHPKTGAIIISIVLFSIGIVLNFAYRPYIQANHINDFHFSDTFGNLLAVPAAFLFLSGIQRKKTKINRSIPLVVLAYVLFELMGLIGLHGTFDVWDIAASIVSGIVTYFISRFVFGIREL